MTAAHPEAARAARARHDLLLRAADLANSLHDPRFGRDRRAEVAALRTARAGAAHVARLAAPPVLGHPALPLWLPPVAGPWPTCALCNAPVERATITQDLARCSTVITAQCHGERETMTISDALLEDRGHRDLVAFRGAARRAVNGS